MINDGDEFHRAENAEERGEGICRTCCEPIWFEKGTIGGYERGPDWSDRIERGGDSLVCFKAVQYRHVPLDGREAAIYDRAYLRARADTLDGAEVDAPAGLVESLRELLDEWESAVADIPPATEQGIGADAAARSCIDDLRELLP